MHDRLVVPMAVKDGGKLPTYAHKTDSGMDVYTSVDVYIKPGQVVLVRTGLYLGDMPEGYEIQLRPRSGISMKTHLQLVNSPSTIDEGYRGEIRVPIKNTDVDLAKYFMNHTFESDMVDVSKLDDEVGPDGYVNRRGPVTYYIPKGTRLVQMVFAKVTKVDFVNTDIQTESDRGSGGFGHTGV